MVLTVWGDRWLAAAIQRRYHFQFLAVFAIVAVTSGIVVSMYVRQSELANRVVCRGHLRQIWQALSMYAQDYEGQYPDEDGWPRGLLPYVDSLASYFCPSDDNIRSARRRKSSSPSVSYWCGMSFDDTGDSTKIPVCGDRMYSNFVGNHDGGGNVAYLDGHVKWRTAVDWQKQGLPIEQLFKRRRK